MRLECAERDRMWDEYDVALGHYVKVTNALASALASEEWISRESESQVKQAHFTVVNLRARIAQHCNEHGCGD